MSTENQNSKHAVIIAIITVIGVLGSALFANWDKVFPKSASPTIALPSVSPPVVSISPIISPSVSSSASTNPSPPKTLNQLESLKEFLSNKNWVEANLATDLLRPESLSCTELASINDLWLEYSNNNFGYSVQRRIWQQKKLNGKYDEFAEFVGWKRDNEYAFNIYAPILNTALDAPHKAPLGHLPFNRWQVKGVIRKDFDVFMSKLAQCNI